jgi:hypothetical protein
MARRHYKSDDAGMQPTVEPMSELAVPQDKQPSATPSAPPVSMPPAEPDDREVLRARLAELENADYLQKQQMEQMRAQQQAALAQKHQWLESHPEYKAHHERLNHLHREALQNGIPDNSDRYFAYLEHMMQVPVETTISTPAATPAPDPAPTEPVRRTMAAPVSAPVTREVRSLSGSPVGSIELSPAQREAAKLAGIDEKTYAANLIKLKQLKLNGQYPDR